MLTLEESHAHFTEWFSSQGGPTEMMVVGMWGEEEAEAESEGEMPNTLVITSAVAMLEGALANLFIGQFGAGAPTRVFVHMANVVNDSVEVNTYLTLVTMLIEEKTDFQCEVSAMITRSESRSRRVRGDVRLRPRSCDVCDRGAAQHPCCIHGQHHKQEARRQGGHQLGRRATMPKTTTPSIYVLSYEEMIAAMGTDAEEHLVLALAVRAFERGDHLVVYRNVDMGHSMLGHAIVMSYGSPEAQIERTEFASVPRKCPVDPGPGLFGWRYMLHGICMGLTPQQVVLNAPGYTEVSYSYRDNMSHAMVRDLPAWYTRDPRRRMTNLDMGIEQWVDPDTDWITSDFRVTKLPDGYISS